MHARCSEHKKDKYKMPSGSRPGPSPGPRMGRPGPVRLWPWAGSAALGILYSSCISWIDLMYMLAVS